MRSLRLLGVAAEAELLRLKREAGGMARAVALQVAAGLFGLIVLGLLHVAAWLWLREGQGTLAAMLYVALGDVVVAGLLFLLARRGFDPVAQEALMLRRQAIAQLRRGSMVNRALGKLLP